jgi:hypothetical protein
MPELRALPITRERRSTKGEVMSAEQEAWAIAVELHKLGIRPVRSGEWIKLQPPPPFDLMMKIIDLPEGMVERLVVQIVDSETVQISNG